jgi:poly(A) polymerase
VEPLVVPRDGHTLSRRQIDPDALKVLYRLHDAGLTAYLVGGGVRDILLGRVPKDFDIATSAHPYQIKRLFRNCFIVGRRFRLAHVRFGTKVIEVATFRRQVGLGEGGPDNAEQAAGAGGTGPDAAGAESAETDDRDHLIHRDNTFGTAEEDAFRRDFTVNALFYDIGTFSIIDYVGGLEDLRAGVIRCIGDPDIRFREDPVRMQRAVAFAARLGFRIDDPVLAGIARHRHELARAAPARLMDEYYKILRTGSAELTFRELEAAGLLEPISTVLDSGADDALWESLARLDAFRRRFTIVPARLTSAVLLGSLLVPLGFSPGGWPTWMEDPERPGLNLGVLPLARKDVERIHQILLFQKRLREPSRSPHARRALVVRSAFEDALTWLDIQGDVPDLVTYWQEAARSASGSHPPATRRPGGRRRGRRRGPRPPRPPET